MRRNLHWSVYLFMLLGMTGVFVMSLLPWLGVLMILFGLAVPIVVLLRSRKKFALPVQRSVSRTARTAQMDRAARTTAAPEEPVYHRVDRKKLGVLRYTLHQANLDSNATVFETKDHKIATVSDILVEMIDIAETYGRSVEELAKDILAMYPKIFDNAALALRQYPDEALAKTYIARKAMTDAGWRLKEKS